MNGEILDGYAAASPGFVPPHEVCEAVADFRTRWPGTLQRFKRHSLFWPSEAG